MSRRTVRWHGAIAATIVFAVVGLDNQNPVLLLAGVVPLAYVAYGTVASASVPPELEAERTVDPTPAPPGRPVDVTLTVRNPTDRTLGDVRVVDDVPPDLAVTAGTPRAGTTLGPDEEVEIDYRLVARRGDHSFGPAHVRVRSLTGGAQATAAVSVAGDDGLACRLEADAPPLNEEADEYVGQLATDRPGRGIEFHSTREYHRGDPARRIDWRHYAKRGELATVNYEQRGAATVVVVLDARDPCRVVAAPGRPTAIELSAYAATRAVTDLLNAGHDVGVALLGLDGPGPAGLHWIEPSGGGELRSRALDLFRLATERRAGAGAGAVDQQIHQLLSLSPPGSQIALFSPLVDDVPVQAVETWRAFTHSTIVVSPDVIPENTISGQYDQIRRRTRLARCQATGVRTLDWRRGTPLPVAMELALVTEDRLGSRLERARSGGGR
jgi:uncharacterized protein (DUF58 family)